MYCEIFSTLLFAVVVISILRIPEIGLVLCLVVGGLFKGNIQQYFGYFDITLFTFFITIFSICINGRFSKPIIPNIKVYIPIVLIVILFAVSLYVTPDIDNGIEYFVRFVLLTVSVLFMVYWWCSNITRVRRLLFTYVIIVLLYCFACFTYNYILGNEVYQWRTPFPNISIIGLAQHTSAAILIGVILLKYISRKGWRLILYIGFIALLLIACFELISFMVRGALIAFIIGLGILVLLYIWQYRKIYALYLLGFCALMVIAFFVLPDYVVNRYLLLFNLDEGTVGMRLDMWQYVINHFSSWWIIGVGLCGFNYYYSALYPFDTNIIVNAHNIFFDVFCSAGILAVICMIWVIGYVFYKLVGMIKKDSMNNKLLLVALGIGLISFLVAGQFSMGILASRPLWFFCAIILAMKNIYSNYVSDLISR